jgi:hypothetical protein
MVIELTTNFNSQTIMAKINVYLVKAKIFRGNGHGFVEGVVLATTVDKAREAVEKTAAKNNDKVQVCKTTKLPSSFILQAESFDEADAPKAEMATV